MSQAAHIARLRQSVYSGGRIPLSECRKILTGICGVPRCVVRRTGAGYMTRFVTSFTGQCFDEMTKATGNNNLEAKPFTLGTEILFPPHTPLDFDGDRMPLGNACAEEFCEAADLYAADAIKYAPLITALLCRPQGERYDQNKAMQRAALIKDLGMETALGIFSLIRNTHRTLKGRFPHCYSNGPAVSGMNGGEYKRSGTCGEMNTNGAKAIESANDGGSSGTGGETTPGETISWYDMLLFTADYVPDRIKAISEMNLYDFMSLTSSRNKLIKREFYA